MTLRATGATVVRVLTGLRRDPRTIALLVAVPAVLLVLFRFVLDRRRSEFDAISVPLLGLFPLISMFLVASITMLRERTGGTLERLMTMPMSKLDLLLGYALAFACMAMVQVLVVCAVAVWIVKVDLGTMPVLVVVVAMLNAIAGMSLGLFVSAFATTEFQAVQFMPAFMFPQLLLCGIFAPRDQMAGVLNAAGAVMPMTYAYDALDRLHRGVAWEATMWLDVGVTVGATLLAVCLGAVTLRRRTD